MECLEKGTRIVSVHGINKTFDKFPYGQIAKALGTKVQEANWIQNWIQNKRVTVIDFVTSRYFLWGSVGFNIWPLIFLYYILMILTSLSEVL